MKIDISTKRRLVIASLLRHEVKDDKLAIKDSVLQAVVSGERRLVPQERRAVIRSPITLKRLQWLQSQKISMRLQSGKGSDSQAGSKGWLRAAAGSDPAFSIDTDDGFYTIHFYPGRSDRFYVALSCSDEHAACLQRENLVMDLVDSEGNQILQGQPDDLGELHGEWRLSESPRKHLSREGVALIVRTISG